MAALAALFLAGCGSADVRTANICDDPRIVAAFVAQGSKDGCERHSIHTYRDFAGEQEIQVVFLPTGTRQDADVIYSIGDIYVRFEDNRLENWGDARKLTALSDFQGDYYVREQLDAYAGLTNCCKPRSNLYRTYLQKEDGKLCRFFEMRHPFQGLGRNCGGWLASSGSVGYAPGAVTWRQARKIVEALALAQIGPQISPAGSIGMFVTFHRDAQGTAYYLAEVSEPVRRRNAQTGRDELRFLWHSWRVETMGGSTAFVGVREADANGQ
ncbi:MAG: hypothetical protein AB7R90_04055 [Reyranellaceae bacterium]